MATLMEDIIELALSLFVEAYVLPPALTAIATTALTSVSSSVVTLFQTLLPLIAVIVTILYFVGRIRRHARGE